MKTRNIFIAIVLAVLVIVTVLFFREGATLQGFTKLYKVDSKSQVKSVTDVNLPNTKDPLEINKNNKKVEPNNDLQIPNAKPKNILFFSMCEPLQLYLTDEKSIQIGDFDGYADIAITGFNNPAVDNFLSAGIRIDDLNVNNPFRVKPGDSFFVNSNNAVGNEYQVKVDAHDLANILVQWTNKNLLLKVSNLNPKFCGKTDFYLKNIKALNRPDFIIFDVDGFPIWVRHAGSNLHAETSVLDLKLIQIGVGIANPQAQAADWEGVEVGANPWEAIVRDGDKLTIDANSNGADDFNIYVNRNENGDLHLEVIEL